VATGYGRLLLFAVVSLSFCVSCGGREDEIAFYVSTEGNDDWDGTIADANPLRYEGPFETIERAREAVRALKAEGKLTKPVTVYVRGGVYTLSEPLVFTPEDSGTEECPVTYAAYPGETAVIRGGREITGWKRGGDGVWTARVPGVKGGGRVPRQLFVNGGRRQRARIPDTGFFTVDGEITMDEKARFRYRGNDIVEEWEKRGDVEVVALQAWAEIRMFIRDVDGETRTVTLSGKCRPSNRERDARYWVENVRDGLNSPGEWYLDRREGVLSYIPFEGEDMENAEVVMPFLTGLVRFEGKPEENRFVHDITLKGLVFRYTDWTISRDGYADVQAAYDIPGVITGNGARSVTIEDCVIEHHGNYGIEFARGCTGIEIIGNEIADMGAGGVKIGEPRDRENQSDKTYGNLVAHNHIHHIGEVYPAACGIIIFRSGRNRIAHNHIHDTYYTGISNGWSWGYAETDTKENVIEFNHVHHIGRGMLSDMGGNYNLGVQPGTVIRNNVFHDITSHGYGGWGIYTDEGSSYILIENNIVYNTKSGGFHQHYGRENVVRNNIFANAREGQIIRTRMEEHVSFTFEHNIVYWREGPLLRGNWSDDKYRFDYNLYFNAEGDPVTFGEWTLDEWRARGQDVHSLIADPLFADPDKGDFTLAPDSPAFKIGFKPIETDDAGPRR